MRKKFRKAVRMGEGLIAGFFVSLAAAANMANAEETGNRDVTAKVVYGEEALAVKSSGDWIYLEEIGSNGKIKGSVERYRISELGEITTDGVAGAKEIDLSSFTTKGGKLCVYSDIDEENKVSITVNKQASKVKAENTDGRIKLTVDGGEVPQEKQQWRKANAGWKTSAADLTKYYEKGVTLYVRRSAEDSTAGNREITDGMPASKEAKLKIRQQSKAPKITFDPAVNKLKFPAGCEVRCIEVNGDSNACAGYGFEALGNEKADRSPSLETFLTGKKLISTVAISTTGSAATVRTTSNAAVFEARIAAKGNKFPSKIAVVSVPWQPVLNAVGDSVSDSGISFDYRYNKAKTKTLGIRIMNASESQYQYAVVKNMDELGSVKWKKAGAKKTVKVGTKNAEEGSYVVYRKAGVKDRAKTPENEFSWASEAKADEKIIAYPAQVKTDLSVTASTPGTADNTASKAAIKTASFETGYEYYYVKIKKAFKKNELLEIGMKVPAEAAKMESDTVTVACAKNDVFAVYVVQPVDKRVIKAGCVKVTEANMK